MKSVPEIDARDLMRAGQVALIFDLDMSCGLALPVARDASVQAPESVIVASSLYMMMTDPEFKALLQKKVDRFIDEMRDDRSMVKVHEIVQEHQRRVGQMPGELELVDTNGNWNPSGGVN